MVSLEETQFNRRKPLDSLRAVHFLFDVCRYSLLSSTYIHLYIYILLYDIYIYDLLTYSYLLLMEEILHQLVGSFSHYLRRVLCIQTVVVWDFWTINSIYFNIQIFTRCLLYRVIWGWKLQLLVFSRPGMRKVCITGCPGDSVEKSGRRNFGSTKISKKVTCHTLGEHPFGNPPTQLWKNLFLYSLLVKFARGCVPVRCVGSQP